MLSLLMSNIRWCSGPLPFFSPSVPACPWIHWAPFPISAPNSSAQRRHSITPIHRYIRANTFPLISVTLHAGVLYLCFVWTTASGVWIKAHSSLSRLLTHSPRVIVTDYHSGHWCLCISCVVGHWIMINRFTAKKKKKIIYQNFYHWPVTGFHGKSLFSFW